jgi:hypothetical protein
MKFRFLWLFVLALIYPLSSHAQYFDTGNDPAGLKWLMIKTERFTLIYPESFGDQGIKYAKSLDNSLNKLAALYPGIKISIPVVIHNYTTFSNGYVSWAPKRIEMYPTPEQNTIPLDPVEQLTSHELTHVMQMYSLKKGFLGFLTILGGQQVTGAASLFLPMWFMEGDAVLAESILTESGRGRNASFQKQMKAVVTGGKKLYSYDKMMFGSFRDYTPDHYQFGFQIAAWSTSKYGHQIWNKALGYTASYPYTIDPILISLKKSTGLTKGGIYRETFDSLKTIWQKDLSRAAPASYKPVNNDQPNEYRNYYSPVTIGSDSIIAIRTSLYAPPSFVLLNPSAKTEKKIFTPGSMWPWYISGGMKKIVWVEDRPDPRWENRTYSVIMLLDLTKGKSIQLSRRTRYMSAAISPDGKYVAAAESSVSNTNSIVIIDAVNGAIIKTTSVPGNGYPQRPEWSSAGDKLTIITLTNDGEGIMSWSPETGKWETLITPGRDDLQSSLLRNDTLFYVSSASGTDNIYMLPQGGSPLMITNSRFGSYDPDLTGNSLYFSDYTPMGYRICRIEPDLKSTPLPGYKMKDSFLINRIDTLKKQDYNSLENKYSPERYNKLTHLFRFHSWMPFYADLEQVRTDPALIKPGVTLFSQNTLSSFITSLGYEYSDGRNNFHYRITWKGWLPVFESRIDYGGAPVIYKMGTTVGDPALLSPSMSFSNAVSVPLSFSTGRFSQFLYGSFAVKYENNYAYQKGSGTYDYGQIQLRSRLYFTNSYVMSGSDIYPRWAQLVDLSYINYPFDNTIYSPLTSLRTAFYFPGFVPNHSLKLRFEADYQRGEQLLLSNIAALPRGYLNMVSLNYKLYSADYTMPLLYPDLSIPAVVYLKRIRGGIFYDFATGKNNYFEATADNIFQNGNTHYTYNKNSDTFSSFGGEILADFYLFRLPFMISGGVQAAWKNLYDAPAVQLLFNIDIFGMKVGKGRLQP